VRDAVPFYTMVSLRSGGLARQAGKLLLICALTVRKPCTAEYQPVPRLDAANLNNFVTVAHRTAVVQVMIDDNAHFHGQFRV
jgi:hypothetical protein